MAVDVHPSMEKSTTVGQVGLVHQAGESLLDRDSGSKQIPAYVMFTLKILGEIELKVLKWE